MIWKKFLFLVLIGVTCTSNVASAEKKGCSKPTVEVVLDKGKPFYHSKPHEELISTCGTSSALGCTISAYSYSYTTHLNDKGCKQLDFNCHPTDIQVYIDDEFPKDSCEYKAIKKHENFHIRALQNFPLKAIKTFLIKCIEKEVAKKQIKNGEQIYTKCARETLDWMNRKRAEKDHEIDSYKKYHPFYFSKCKWSKTDRASIKATLDNLLPH